MFLLCNACCFCLKLGAVGKVMEEKGKSLTGSYTRKWGWV